VFRVPADLVVEMGRGPAGTGEIRDHRMGLVPNSGALTAQRRRGREGRSLHPPNTRAHLTVYQPWYWSRFRFWWSCAM
jgi:hypothetical protein